MTRPSALLRRRSIAVLAGALIATALIVQGCDSDAPRNPPLILLGIDGADWGVIEELWEHDRLPHLRELAERGSSSPLKTGWGSKSPVIWTTMATGVVPERHGITDFVLMTKAGAVPVSSADRKKPALWNMLSATDRKVGVLGWWPTWPAETINGWMLTDRVRMKLKRRFHPRDWGRAITRTFRESEQRWGFPPLPSSDRDELMATAAHSLVNEDFDLLMVYIKTTDEASHQYWKYFRPDRFASVDEARIERWGDYIPQAYEAADRLLGELMAARPDANFMVVSDHGFYGLEEEQVTFHVDFDEILAQLGLLRRDSDGNVDRKASAAFTWKSSPADLRKTVRLSTTHRGGSLTRAEALAFRNTLGIELERLRWEDGTPAASLKAARPDEAEDADLVVTMLSAGTNSTLTIDGEPTDLVTNLQRLSGSHGGGTPGVFSAAGPSFRKDADIRAISVLDITPTVLFALGLPVAEDFDGRVVSEIFTSEFKQRSPLQSIASWGDRSAEGGIQTEADSQLIEELEALGYL